MNGLGRPSVRAVFYKHKNSEQSLDQELNSVEAHKEASTARLRSASPTGRPEAMTPIRS